MNITQFAVHSKEFTTRMSSCSYARIKVLSPKIVQGKDTQDNLYKEFYTSCECQTIEFIRTQQL